MKIASTLTINFDTETGAENFLEWLLEQGEQDFQLKYNFPRNKDTIFTYNKPVISVQVVPDKPQSYLDYIKELIETYTVPQVCEDCDSTEAKHQVCPYAAEIHCDYELHWLCDECAEKRAWDIQERVMQNYKSLVLTLFVFVIVFAAII